MKKLKKLNLCAVALASAALLSVSAVAGFAQSGLSANANSGPSSWNGVTASGAFISGENCPIEVESEVLTFDIRQLIDHSAEKEELLEYSSVFSAEYTFKNPTKNTVNATLAFPLGQYSDLGFWENGEGGHNDKFIYLEDAFADKGMYKVFADGAAVAAEMRYTFHEWNDFDFVSESKQLCDGYREHSFFYRDMPVYKYVFRFVSEETDYFNAEATLKNTENLRFAGSYGTVEKGKVITYSVKNGDEVELYSIGGEIDAEAVGWEFYKTSGYFGLNIKRVKAQAVYETKSAEQITFKEYVFNGYSGGNEASEREKQDFYNAALDCIDGYSKSSILPENFAFLQGSSSSYLLRWLVYDLHFSAGQTIKNTVSAPLFSGGYYNYDPYVYSYRYLLSPAREWSGFKSLEIRLNTPYYLINSSLSFEKTDGGYVYKQDGLPNGELEFDLCTVENPEHKVNYGYTVFAVIGIIILIIALGMAVMVPLAIIIIVIVWLVKRSKKSGGGNGANSGFKPMNTFKGE